MTGILKVFKVCGLTGVTRDNLDPVVGPYTERFRTTIPITCCSAQQAREVFQDIYPNGKPEKVTAIVVLGRLQ